MYAIGHRAYGLPADERTLFVILTMSQEMVGSAISQLWNMRRERRPSSYTDNWEELGPTQFS